MKTELMVNEHRHTYTHGPCFQDKTPKVITKHLLAGFWGQNTYRQTL